MFRIFYGLLLTSPSLSLRVTSPGRPSGLHQQPGALAAAERQRCVRGAAPPHPHSPARQEAEQERDPAPRPQVYQLPGQAPDGPGTQGGPQGPGWEPGG